MTTNSNNEAETKSFDLWPIPSSSHFPSTPEATQKLRELLKLNHKNWHIFYDEIGRHDRITHNLLALWSLGSNAEVLQSAYNLHVKLQSPIGGERTEQITKENVWDHLGDRAYYKAYLDFFTSVVRDMGPAAALEEYVFSEKANFGSKNKEGKYPEMLNRFLGGVLHAVIHVGYGAEFGLPGMWVEGLAQAAVNEASSGTLTPPSLFEATESTALAKKDKNGVHAFTILTRVLKDKRFEIQFDNFFATFQSVMNQCGAACVEYTEDWLPSPNSLEMIQQKIQELEWALTLMCVVPGFQGEEKEYNADFLAMHFVTSSLFLRPLVSFLSPRSQVLLLRTYFSSCLAVWTILGRPQLDLEGFFASPLHPESSSVAKHKFALATNTNPNPWLDVFARAIVHPDDHVPKFQRAMYVYATRYGSTAGFFANTELSGAERIDGTLFVRGAWLTAKRLGREVDKVPKEICFWDRRGLRKGVVGDVY
ncbi:hypothetical protein WG66_013067 [Moniliophthora roreri]|uniref:Uncharacterized protein n=1 Tax=Moniliophthora roreri TaxID=221103 RepID=A0A0W0FIB9_MONRR|nr:hypothetical protein WG66_013067 [Moniliophthora roreri]